MNATTNNLPLVERLQAKKEVACEKALEALEAGDQDSFIKHQKRANDLLAHIESLLRE